MIPGNHDCMAEDAIYRRYDFNGIPNVTMLAAPEGEVARLDALGDRLEVGREYRGDEVDRVAERRVGSARPRENRHRDLGQVVVDEVIEVGIGE